jgi:hypothetical protein
MESKIEYLLAASPGSDPIIFEDSGWLEGLSVVESEIKLNEIKSHYFNRLNLVKIILGEPIKSGKEYDSISEWYPEAIEYSLWSKNGLIIVLAVEHADKETPICVVMRCLSLSEIDELKL